MRVKTIEKVETERTVLIECDRCEKQVEFDDIVSRQEWVIVGGSGGYASRYWGDGTGWHADLCETCQYELFSPFAVITKDG